MRKVNIDSKCIPTNKYCTFAYRPEGMFYHTRGKKTNEAVGLNYDFKEGSDSLDLNRRGKFFTCPPEWCLKDR